MPSGPLLTAQMVPPGTVSTVELDLRRNRAFSVGFLIPISVFGNRIRIAACTGTAAYHLLAFSSLPVHLEPDSDACPRCHETPLYIAIFPEFAMQPLRLLRIFPTLELDCSSSTHFLALC